jgi:aryl-alcohol dehydrogenase-like predicted oxidoreductase
MSKILNSKLILGTVQMGIAYGINNTKGKIPLDQSHAILKYAFDRNIRILDTAEAYGNAHEIIGEFHKKHPQKKFEIITKLPHHLEGTIQKKVDDYKETMQVDRLHALLFHSFSSYKAHLNVFEAIVELKRNQSIKYIGVSVYTNQEIEEVLQNDDVDIIQLPFNVFDNQNLRGDIIKKAKLKGKIIHTRSAFLQGLFFKDPNSDHQTITGLKPQLVQLSSILENNNLSVQELALNYCIQQQNIDNVIIGVDSQLQLQVNLDVLENKLQNSTISQINEIKIEDKDLLNPSLWA